ncbi:MAG: DUF6152 family protein [Arenicellaceae bacterium]|nr:DUF6152 family protein [Arenicellaceae bacterium]
MNSKAFLALILLFLMTAISHGHHSIAPFDRAAWFEFEGEVIQLSWRNPHLGLTARLTNDDGTNEDWQIEADAINSLMRRGLTREDFAVGEKIRFGGWPSSQGRQALLSTNVLLANGQEYIMRDTDTPLVWTSPEEEATNSSNPVIATDLFRVWSYEALYVRKSPFKLTDKSEQAIAVYDPFLDMPSLRCIPPGMPNAILSPYPFEFVQEGDNILLNIEEWESQRFIDMTSFQIPQDAPRTRLGYSIGKFENSALLVRTERLSGGLLDDDGTLMSQDAAIDEIFTIADDGITLNYQVTVTDPEYLVEPATYIAAWRWNPDTIMRSFECDPEVVPTD